MFQWQDDIGQTLTFEQLPQRIISLVPSITATFFDLNADNLLVGRTKFCIHPSPQIDSIPIVGGTKNIHLDRILALQPDLVICNQEENTSEIFEDLRQHQIPVFVNETKTIQDNSKLILQIGAVTGQSKLAHQINLRIETALDSVKDMFTNEKTIYLIWKDPYMSVGNDTFIHHILEHVGLENCMHQHTRYPSLTLDDITEIAPKYLLLSTEPFPFGQKHIDFFQQLLPDTKVVLVQGEYFSWYGSMMLEAADYFKKVKISHFC